VKVKEGGPQIRFFFSNYLEKELITLLTMGKDILIKIQYSLVGRNGIFAVGLGLRRIGLG
jgi:hypothetical protein